MKRIFALLFTVVFITAVSAHAYTYGSTPPVDIPKTGEGGWGPKIESAYKNIVDFKAQFANSDGTLKAGVSATQWQQVTGPVTWVSSTSFKVPTTALFELGRKVWVNQTTDVIGEVFSATDAAGETTVVLDNVVLYSDNATPSTVTTPITSLSVGMTAPRSAPSSASNIGAGIINLRVSAFDTPRATAVSDMTSGDELPWAGPEHQVGGAANALKNAATSAYIGQDWGVGNTKVITGFRYSATSDLGAVNVINPNITLTLEGSTTGAWGGEEVSLGSVGPTVDSNSLVMEKMTGITVSTAYRYHRLVISQDGAANTIYASRVHFFTADSGSFQNVGITADNLTLRDSAGNTYDTGTTNLNCDLTATGANGRQSGAMGSEVTFLIYAISDGTTDACFTHLSTETLTLPGSYDKWRFVSSLTTDTSSELRYATQNGDAAWFVEDHDIVTGLALTSTYKAQDVSAVIPTKSGRIKGLGLGAVWNSGGNYTKFSYDGYGTVGFVAPANITGTDASHHWLLGSSRHASDIPPNGNNVWVGADSSQNIDLKAISYQLNL